MSYPSVLSLNLNDRRDNQSRSFSQDICKPTSCLYHRIPPPRDTSVITRLWDLPLPFLNPVYEPKSTVHLLTFAFTITNQKSNSQPLHSAHPFHCTYVCYVCCLFWLLLFLCTISLAFHLLFGPRAASLLLNWLIDYCFTYQKCSNYTDFIVCR